MRETRPFAAFVGSENSHTCALSSVEFSPGQQALILTVMISRSTAMATSNLEKED